MRLCLLYLHTSITDRILNVKQFSTFPGKLFCIDLLHVVAYSSNLPFDIEIIKKTGYMSYV